MHLFRPRQISGYPSPVGSEEACIMVSVAKDVQLSCIMAGRRAAGYAWLAELGRGGCGRRYRCSRMSSLTCLHIPSAHNEEKKVLLKAGILMEWSLQPDSERH